MGSCSFKNDMARIHLINKQPISLNMALSPTLETTNQFVIVVQGIKLLACNERANDHLEFLKIFISLLHPFDIF